MNRQTFLNFQDIAEKMVLWPNVEQSKCLQVRFSIKKTDYILHLNEIQLESLLTALKRPSIKTKEVQP